MNDKQMGIYLGMYPTYTAHRKGGGWEIVMNHTNQTDAHLGVIRLR